MSQDDSVKDKEIQQLWKKYQESKKTHSLVKSLAIGIALTIFAAIVVISTWIVLK